MTRHFVIALILALGAATASAKEPAECAYVLGAGQPALSKPAGRTQLLCYRAYAVLYSAQTRTALWSAERLTKQAVEAARSLPRDSDFYEEERLPAADRARLQDFSRSGMDRGHLAPSGDFADKASQAESFSLANVVPQNSISNRRTWSHIETSTRRLARQYGAIQVVTGPAFSNNSATLNGRVRIPDFLWKAIYVPGVGAAAYVVRNDETPAYSAISIDELAHFTGIDPFPTLTRAQRATASDLPAPTPHPGEKAARRVAFAWLASGEALGEKTSSQTINRLVGDAGALATLLLAYAR
nr:DNA/RNA non-specific endonuclease [uncultured Cupriavidus sp.]